MTITRRDGDLLNYWNVRRNGVSHLCNQIPLHMIDLTYLCSSE